MSKLYKSSCSSHFLGLHCLVDSYKNSIKCVCFLLLICVNFQTVQFSNLVRDLERVKENFLPYRSNNTCFFLRDLAFKNLNITLLFPCSVYLIFYSLGVASKYVSCTKSAITLLSLLLQPKFIKYNGKLKCLDLCIVFNNHGSHKHPTLLAPHLA